MWLGLYIVPPGIFQNVICTRSIKTFSLRNIQEVVITLLFPDLPGWLFMSAMSVLLIYGVFGGIRVIVGFVLIYFIFGQLIYCTLLMLKYYSGILQLISSILLFRIRDE
ncbi:GerAB/ArcD/ProY family transporter [Paenibacillus sp. R14(2021)]|uniref:GerAB/ArcD/ProY family transporter n=1 Tax=Paenibacillus sp. R14(2021) TaxID=2859228 RepID=UPI001C613ABA